MRLPHRKWQPWELDVLRVQYPVMLTATIAAIFERPASHIYAMAQRLGVKKSAEFQASAASGRLDGKRGYGSRFVKGMEPPNKGLRRPGWHRGRMKETQFKKGHRPHTWKPIGTEKVDSDGYLRRKLTDTGYPPKDWVAVHRINWEAAHGPIPKGHMVIFRDGNKKNVAVENLECISFKEQMRRNTLHRLPKPIAHAYQLLGAVKRQINRRTRA